MPKLLPAIASTALCIFSFALQAATNIVDIPNQRGTRITGQAAGDGLGGSAAGIGDVNKDGRADFALTASGVDRGGTLNVGAVFVILGTDTPPNNINVSSLTGTNGFKVSGSTIPANTSLGTFVRGVGDVNNDDVDDFLVGTGVGISALGSAYVIFGKPAGQNFAANVDVDNLGTGGFRLTAETSGDWFGISVGGGGGDVNGDGIDDFVIGAQNASGQNGRVFLLFGRSSWPATVNVGTDAQTIKLNSRAAGDQFGSYAVIDKDINNDNIPDIFIGAFASDTTANGNEGAVQVFFGRTAANPWSSISAAQLNGSNGFRLNGVEINAGLGIPTAGLGDFNGDGVGDFYAATPDGFINGAFRRGHACVVFGSANWSADISLSSLDGNNGVCFTGEANGDRAGFDAAGVGDVNGDTRADLILSANGADNVVADAGKVYVIYGQNSFAAGNVSLAGIENTLAGELFLGTALNFRPNAVAGIGKFSNADTAPDFVMTAENGVDGDAYLVYRAGGGFVQFRDGFE